MRNLPETIGVLTFNPKTSKKLLNIMKEYFECMPYILYTAGANIYVLPNTKTIDAVLYKMYDYFDDYLDIDIFRSATYKYNSRSRTYDILNNSWYRQVLPSYIRISSLDIEKLKTLVGD